MDKKIIVFKLPADGSLNAIPEEIRKGRSPSPRLICWQQLILSENTVTRYLGVVVYNVSSMKNSAVCF